MRLTFHDICKQLRVSNDYRRRAGLMHNDSLWGEDVFGLTSSQARFLRARGIPAEPGYVVVMSQIAGIMGAWCALYRPRTVTSVGKVKYRRYAPVRCSSAVLREAVGAWNAHHGRL